jgi:hypothetical protein
MSTPAQRKASATHRRRASKRGLVRLEVQVPQGDAALLRELANRLRGTGTDAKSARTGVRILLAKPVRTALDVFASDLPDSYFEGVFEHRKRDMPRDVDL